MNIPSDDEIKAFIRAANGFRTETRHDLIREFARKYSDYILPADSDKQRTVRLRIERLRKEMEDEHPDR